MSLTEEKIGPNIKLLEAKIQAYFGRLQGIYDLSSHVATAKTQERFMSQSANVEVLRSEFNNLVEQLNAARMQADEEYVPSFQTWEAFEEMFSHIQHVTKQLTAGKSDGALAPVASPAHLKPNLKLPPIVLQTFDGDQKKFASFLECFNSTVHRNAALTDAERVFYLCGQLSGKALATIAGIVPCGENYKLIYDTLVDKYEDVRLLGTSYLDELFNFKQLESPSAKGLNDFVDCFVTSAAAFDKLEISDKKEFIFLYLALKKIDPETGRMFENSVRSEKRPKYTSFLTFIKEQAKILERRGDPGPASNVACANTTQRAGKSQGERAVCQCGGARARNMLPAPSLSPTAAEIPAHLDSSAIMDSPVPLDSPVSATTSGADTTNNVHVSYNYLQANIAPEVTTAMLATAKVTAIDKNGKIHYLRCMIDNGSQNHFITTAAFNKLSLSYLNKELPTTVSGFGGVPNATKGKAQLTIRSCYKKDVTYDITALVSDRIALPVPTARVDRAALTFLSGVPLADDEFHVTGDIDLLIGVELFGTLLMSGRVHGPPGSPDVLESTLGFLVMGKTPVALPQSKPRSVALCAFTGAPLNKLVENFFELEEVPTCTSTFMSADEQACEENYKNTTTRDDSGRYSVALPFKSSPEELGNSLVLAEKRFLSLERKFSSTPPLRTAYDDIVREYIEKGYLNIVTGDSREEGYVIAHHGVVRNDKISTKLRLVLDASAPTDKNVSLNSILNPGPNLQSDLFLVLLNFRLFPVAFCADVKQMYLQIQVHPEFRKYQRILYRFKPGDPLQLYEFERVCFGLSVSPYLALRTIQQLAVDEGPQYPRAAELIRRGDYYMDDVASSAPSEKIASKTAAQLIDMFKAGGFDLMKWSSNSPELLKAIPKEYLHPSWVEFGDGSYQKVLGIKWEPRSDSFSFEVNSNTERCTKRNILSVVARLWDILGFAAPVILYAKLMIKQLWLEHIDWDQTPPSAVIDAWVNFVRDLPLLSQMRIPRHVGVTSSCTVTLLAFADASEKAYGAVLYLHVVANQSISVRFLCAKSKVAPMKVVSLARLELCAAWLMSKLVRIVMDNYSTRISLSHIYAFSDSTVTLHWIHSSPHRWKIFVANRVAKIQKNLPSDCFFHVSGKENPSDCLSRGLTPSQLLEHPLWLRGPSWARLERSKWPIKPFVASSEGEVPEQKVIALPTVATVAPPAEEPVLYTLSKRISSWLRYLRVIVYVLRFIKLLSSKGAVTTEDTEAAELAAIKTIQTVHFPEYLEVNPAGKAPASKAIRKLRPILVDGVLRVGGRLDNANLTFDHKHPFLLPRKDHVVNLIIDYTHRKNCHAGEKHLLSLLRLRYWILSARVIVRSRVDSCLRCFKARPKGITPPAMANLPECRLQISKAFAHTGVDLCGPLNVTLVRKRGAKSQKMYVCVFICLTTRSTHVEICADLSSETFLNALKRFISRRGPVDTMYSDNATNFVGADSHLKKLLNQGFSDTFRRELLENQVKWRFIPPNAPHWGGSWEAAVKSFKTHLFRVIGAQILSYDELYTLLCQIEAVLNSRPLGLLSADPAEPAPLTPAHFLNTVPLRSLPASEITEERTNRLSRYSLLENLVQSYWRRWSLEFLHTLQAREKWNTDSRPITVGTVVLIITDNAPPLHWPMGIVMETYPGKDGAIRVVLVKTKNGTYRRPVVRLCPLPNNIP
ncbi:uncharacterized protein LOC134664029 [Cydia fagiglandana]|uniref:uncharacterized protein LOC134664029 n=1 Tax=Cydia fagiglandana TaxID=1458189 RepID=UPI002FEE5D09